MPPSLEAMLPARNVAVLAPTPAFLVIVAAPFSIRAVRAIGTAGRRFLRDEPIPDAAIVPAAPRHIPAPRTRKAPALVAYAHARTLGSVLVPPVGGFAGRVPAPLVRYVVSPAENV